jgi:hypothetical protein
MVQAEPWLERDKAMIDQLKTIGIERGKPFEPGTKTEQILNDAIQEAKAWFDARYDTLPPYYEGEHWFFPSTAEMIQNVMSDWRVPDSYPVDARGAAYTLAFFSAKHLGESQYYLLTGNDRDGKPLDGKSSYRLRVPANAPVTQYWSMTVYGRATHTFIRNARWVGRSSQTPGPQKNADGAPTSSSARQRRQARNRSGSLPTPMADLRSSPASTVLKRRCSTRPGNCRTSSVSPLSN